MKLKSSRAYLFMSIALLFLFNPKVSAQSSPGESLKFVQFEVQNLNTSSESKSIDNLIRSKKGIFMSRTDHNTKICFCIFNETAQFDKYSFEAWLNSLGFQIKCYREGVHGVDKVFSKKEFEDLCN